MPTQQKIKLIFYKEAIFLLCFLLHLKSIVTGPTETLTSPKI